MPTCSKGDDATCKTALKRNDEHVPGVEYCCVYLEVKEVPEAAAKDVETYLGLKEGDSGHYCIKDLDKDWTPRTKDYIAENAGIKIKWYCDKASTIVMSAMAVTSAIMAASF